MARVATKQEIGSWGDEALKSRYDQIEVAEAALRGEKLVVVAEIERRRAYEADGATSIANWVAGRSGSTLSTAHQLADVASAAAEMPAIGEAVTSGSISWDVAAEVTKMASPENVEALVDSASSWSGDMAKNYSRRSSQITAEEQRAIDDSRSLRRYYNKDKTQMNLRGLFPTVDGEAIWAVIERIVAKAPKKVGDEYIAFDQRAADALVELASYLPADASDPIRATLVCHIDYDALISGVGTAEIGEGYASVEVARGLGCMGRFQAVVDDIDGTPIGVGRASRNTPPYIERLVRERDKVCVFPGCNLEGQVHHSQWWARDNGRTDIELLVLLCPFHHLRLIHGKGWILTGTAIKGWVFTSPDGKRYEVAPRPPPSLVGRAGPKPKSDDKTDALTNVGSDPAAGSETDPVLRLPIDGAA